MSFPFFRQPDAMDCGPACLKMVADFYKKDFSIAYLRSKCFITREGVSFLGLSEAADLIGFRTMGVKISFEMLKDNVPLPCIVHWNQKHFVVVYRIHKDKILVADPASGIATMSRDDFITGWATTLTDGKRTGLALIIEPTTALYETENIKEKSGGFRFLLRYFRFYKKYSAQILLGLILGSVIQLIIPFLTQSVIDVGINNNDLGFIYLILFAQLALVIGRMSVEFIRGWLLLYIGSKVNVAVISGFLQKIMSLPVSFFETKLAGDILQRIDDNNRIEEFLTSTTLSILFSFVNLFIFGIVLAIYSMKLFCLFIAGSALYITWVVFFVKPRANLDLQRFKEMSASNSKLLNIINGIQEIKLTQSELSKRWEWEGHQGRLFGLKLKSMGLLQHQTAGATVINEITNILITIIAATSVIKGEMTLGMMLAVQFIIGQLNLPLNQVIGFLRISQDAKLSLDRLAEVHDMQPEEPGDTQKLTILPAHRDINLKNLSYQYEGPRSAYALKDVNLLIEENKTTSIVGPSGSGKTTLLKLILGLYQPVNGEITIGDTLLSSLSIKTWRENVGAIMQDGFIFPDTIAGNIAPGMEKIDIETMLNAVAAAQLRQFIESLPLGYNTKIGTNGHGLSEGQKQRILLARVIYKNPSIVIFDEATNSLDAMTEKRIMDNLANFFKGKTVVIVAHRLSTIRNADKIVVLDKGMVVETGNHTSLMEACGTYYNIVSNQIESNV
ncbi:MAG TPA: peptidase domain-containing ABC transporter [Bacteroidales bacterium]|nr:peptidase domain-containing ABC transporter [Bacteroidales bacterium]